MKMPTEIADVENRYYSMSYTSGPSSPLGESGRPTAYGVFETLKKAVEFKEGKPDLDGKSAVVIGLGAVGMHMAADACRQRRQTVCFRYQYRKYR